MTGSLTDRQIDTLLISQVIGRLGCYVDEMPYVVPITYAYEAPYVYSHTREGTKIAMMRQQERVCLQVDQIDNLVNWRSAIVWGTFEELTGEEAETGRLVLKNRLYPLPTSVYTRALLDTDARQISSPTMQQQEVIYRIKIERTSGRFEKS